jgi:hypothetical protein
MSDKYILDEHNIPKPVDDVVKWAEWFEESNRRVKRTVYNDVNDNEVVVSTVFLGLDHNFSGKGPPILFETMVFGGKFDQEYDRYSTWEAATIGHDVWVRKIAMSEETS